MPFHPRAEREADQGPLQLGAALDEAGERPLVAILVHDPWCHLTPPHGQARDGSAYDNVSRVSHAARVATPESRHVLFALRSASGPGQLESGCELAAPPFPPAGEELALLRRRSDVNFMRRLPGLPRNRTLFSRQRRRAGDESACISGCSEASSRITRGQRGDKHLSTSRYSRYQRDVSGTRTVLVSLLILKSADKEEFEKSC